MDLEKALHSLPKKSPSQGFIKASKGRLLSQIEHQENESWLKVFLKKLKPITPSRDFIVQARVRLIEKIHEAEKPVWAWLTFAKRFAASTLVMAIAVTATLFFVEGRTTVSAAENTYIQILSGRATLKHTDLPVWDEINGRIDLSAGDLIKLDDGGEAIIHFFDDTELRLSGSTLLLLSQVAVSPIYARQGIIEVSLHEGNAWVQTLNVDDGHAGFTLVTRDAVIKALNASFDVHTQLQDPTTVRVFANQINLTTLHADTRQLAEEIKVNTYEKVSILPSFNSKENPLITNAVLTDQEKVADWVEKNLHLDHERLTKIRQNELSLLYQSAGTLPGEMLYPIKQAKERLKLAFTFSQSEIANTQIEIANKRLNEAIVLLGEGNAEKAKEALMIYQEISRDIAAKTKEQKVDKTVAKRLITPHQKSMVASIPGPSHVDIVKQTLNQTKELLAENPIERDQVRLENTLDELKEVNALVQMGNLNAVKTALKEHTVTATKLLNKIDSLHESEKEETLKKLVEMRNEELKLLKTIAQDVRLQKNQDAQLAAIINDALRETEAEAQRTLVAAAPFFPMEVKEIITPQELSAMDKQIQVFVDKVNIYKTWQGQKNQINRLLKQNPRQADNMVFLQALHSNLDGRIRDLINTKILELEAEAKLKKHKLVKMKIDRSKRLIKQ